MKVGQIHITNGNGTIFDTGSNHDLNVTLNRGAWVNDEEFPGEEHSHSVSDLVDYGVEFTVIYTTNISTRMAHAAELALQCLEQGGSVKYAQQFFKLCCGNTIPSRNRNEFVHIARIYIVIEARRQLQEEERNFAAQLLSGNSGKDGV